MSDVLSSYQVGLALMGAGLSPFTLDTDLFQIVWNGENYLVHTDHLPEIYIQKDVPLYCFEYKSKNWIIYFAMDRVNLRRTPVVAFRGYAEDVVSFRICLQPESTDSIRNDIDFYFAQIERSIDAFGQACEIAVREDEEGSMIDSCDDSANTEANIVSTN